MHRELQSNSKLSPDSSSSVTSVSPVVKSFSIASANTFEEIARIRELFLEYAQSLGFSLCFQSFDKELAGLPGDYGPPDGRLLLGTYDGAPAGCVGLHKLAPEICEMKRLYVRGKGFGRVLAERVIADARQIGYHQLRLDTVEPMMRTAVAMYGQLGFREIAPYRENPIEGALYLELQL